MGATQCQTAVHNFSWRGEKVALSWSVFVFSLGRIGVPLHIKARGRNTEKLNFQPQWLLQMKSKGWGSMGPFSGGECFLKESQQWTCLAFGGPCPPIVHTPQWLPSLWARYTALHGSTDSTVWALNTDRNHVWLPLCSTTSVPMPLEALRLHSYKHDVYAVVNVSKWQLNMFIT